MICRRKSWNMTNLYNFAQMTDIVTSSLYNFAQITSGHTEIDGQSRTRWGKETLQCSLHHSALLLASKYGEFMSTLVATCASCSIFCQSCGFEKSEKLIMSYNILLNPLSCQKHGAKTPCFWMFLACAHLRPSWTIWSNHLLIRQSFAPGSRSALAAIEANVSWDSKKV